MNIEKNEIRSITFSVCLFIYLFIHSFVFLFISFDVLVSYTFVQSLHIDVFFSCVHKSIIFFLYYSCMIAFTSLKTISWNGIRTYVREYVTYESVQYRKRRYSNTKLTLVCLAFMLISFAFAIQCAVPQPHYTTPHHIVSFAELQTNCTISTIRIYS